MTKIHINGIDRDMTAEEQAVFDARQTAWNNKSADRKLAEIRNIRNQKLSETDYLGVSDNSMSSDWVAKRKSWRDIPQDYSADKYDELLAINSDGELTHSVWSKP